MESIKKIYRKGYGPSSSHTMAPYRAAVQFRTDHPGAAAIRVTLYGSLAATGRGHHTDKALTDGSAPLPVEIVWKPDVVLPFHTNGMHFEALDAKGTVTSEWTIYSVGGGALANETQREESLCVYDKSTLSEILPYIEHEGMTYWEYVQLCEGDSIWPYLQEMWEVMQNTICEGLQAEGVIPGGLHLRSKARQYYVRASSYKPSLQSRALVIAYALATSERNAAGGHIVTAPTCGSSGPPCCTILRKRTISAIPRYSVPWPRPVSLPTSSSTTPPSLVPKWAARARWAVPASWLRWPPTSSSGAAPSR